MTMHNLDPRIKEREWKQSINATGVQLAVALTVGLCWLAIAFLLAQCTRR